ncbi:glycosyltransferase family 39 protein [Sporolactobacillus vineae]|uniref:glycosyltransferase family 39 protein n=1 Tax=Sporolactobacillus vineae TaxID=444463 RepID=UPI0002895E9D|nr:glycosyltransferase family 39 protein [Sporolactobacillus vineae]
MKNRKRPLIVTFSLLSGLMVLSILFLSVLFPAFDWVRKKLYLGSQFHSLRITAALLVFAAVAVSFYFLLYTLLLQFGHYGKQVTAAFLWTVTLLVETGIIICFHGILPPGYDGGHTYAQAVDLIKNDGLVSGYFQIYPNNIGVTVVRYWLYRLFSFGNPAAYPYIDQVACAASLTAGIFFSWKFIKESLSAEAAHVMLLMTLTCFPLFLYIVYFYTDSVSMMFPPLLLYLTYRYRKTGKISDILLIGLFLAVSCQIRINMILMLPALILYYFLIRQPKKVLVGLVVCAVSLFAVTTATQSYIQSLGFTKNLKLQMPASDWLLMGLSHSGRYNIKDYNRAMKQPTAQRKQQVVFKAIQHRIKSKGLIRMGGTWILKDARVFGDGLQAYYWQTYDTTDYSVPYNYLYGNEKQLTVFLIQVFHVAVLIPLAFAVLRLFRKKQADENLFIQLCLFGSFIFYVFIWEAEPRYSLLFTLLELCGSAYGIVEMHDLYKKYLNSQQSRPGRILPVMLSLLCLFGAVMAAGYQNERLFTQTQEQQKLFCVDQTSHRGHQAVRVSRMHDAGQTFLATRTFDHLALQMSGHRGTAIYQAGITDLKHHTVYGRTNFRIYPGKKTRLIMLHWIRRKVFTGKPGYLLTIRQIHGSKGAALDLSMNGTGLYGKWDTYPGGALYENGRRMPDYDLTFQVYRTVTHPYMGDELYDALIVLPLGILLILMFETLNGIRRTRPQQGGAANQT